MSQGPAKQPYVGALYTRLSQGRGENVVELSQNSGNAASEPPQVITEWYCLVSLRRFHGPPCRAIIVPS